MTFPRKAPAQILAFPRKFSGDRPKKEKKSIAEQNQRTMATGASVASFYGTSLPRPFLLPVEV